MAKSKSVQKQNSSQVIFTRFLFVVAIFIAWIGVIAVRLVHLQVNQSEWLKDKALDQRRYELKSKMLRGSILDNSGRALAISVRVKSLYADPREIEDVQKTAQKLAAVLKVKPNTLAADIQQAKDNNKRFVWIARKLDEEKAQKLNELLRDETVKKFDEPKFQGLHWREEQKRSYPYGSLASQIVGFSDLDDVGRAGIELSHEQSLRGAVTKTWRERDRLGRVYDESEVEDREPPKDIVLTINNSIQYKVEQALKEGVENASAKFGMAVVLDPKTGEILALANYPTYDPNKFNEASPDHYANKAIQSIYAPGSVFKLITYSSALDKKIITPTGMVNCGGGAIDVAGHVFRDKHCHAGLDYTEAFAISSNIGAIRNGMSVGKESFYDYARKFGFGEATGVELPGEVRGQFRSPEKWFGDSLASMSIGYEMGVTALQMTSAFATIANDGVRVKPHIIKEIRSSNGEQITVNQPEKRQVVSAETARAMREMMKKVVVEGTGKQAQLNGYSSSGKTGTAWKFDPKTKRVSSSKYVSSFIGVAPANDPAIVIGVVMDEPQGAARNGGQVSAPVFREIAEQILPELNIPRDGTLRDENGVAIKDSEIPQDLFGDNLDARKPEAEEPEAEGIQNQNQTPIAVAPVKSADKPSENSPIKKDVKEGNHKLSAVPAPVKEEKKDKKPEEPKPKSDVPKPPLKKPPPIAAAKPETKNKSSDERKKSKT